MSDSNDTGAFLTGFIIGGLVGAAAALLMTPQPGERTRLQIQERGSELKTRLDDLTVEARGQAGKLTTGIQERGSGLKTQLGDLTVEARGRAEKLASEVQERGKIVLEERIQRGGVTTETPSDEKGAAETSSEEGDEAAADDTAT